jgi:hypothetical protein
VSAGGDVSFRGDFSARPTHVDAGGHAPERGLMRVAVLGAGLQGACAALALAARGARVELFDREDECVTQASAQNEGKIHLGFVYAKDGTARSARAMVRGALSFAPLLRRWLGPALDAVPVSSPFHYAVHVDSMVSPDEVRAHLRTSHDLAAGQCRHESGDYFRRDCLEPSYELSPRERACMFDDRTVRAAFRTPEIAIEPGVLASIVRRELRAVPEITLRLRTTVRAVSVSDHGAAVRFEADGVAGGERYDHVVNALWDGRLAIDASAGIPPHRSSWLWRFKHYLLVGLADPSIDIPSVTVVLGAFGDVVNYRNARVFLSWYPIGCVMRSSEIRPPATEPLDEARITAMREGILAGVASVLPAVAALSPDAIDACVLRGGLIFAWGGTDITDPGSGLHERFEIGVRTHGRLHTIDTGKLTTAPLFAEETAKRILALE